MDVFENRGYPQIIHFKRLFHCKPIILGVPQWWNPPSWRIWVHKPMSSPDSSCPSFCPANLWPKLPTTWEENRGSIGMFLFFWSSNNGGNAVPLDPERLPLCWTIYYLPFFFWGIPNWSHFDNAPQRPCLCSPHGNGRELVLWTTASVTCFTAPGAIAFFIRFQLDGIARKASCTNTGCCLSMRVLILYIQQSLNWDKWGLSKEYLDASASALQTS